MFSWVKAGGISVSSSLGCLCLRQLQLHSEMATMWSLFALPASSVITGGAQEMRKKVFLTCCIPGCGYLPIPKALQHFTTRTGICVHTRCVCIFWDVTLAPKCVEKFSPVWSLPGHKNIWPRSALSCLVRLCFSKHWSVLSLSLSLIAPGFD